jgi:hypothetical protein
MALQPSPLTKPLLEIHLNPLDTFVPDSTNENAFDACR